MHRPCQRQNLLRKKGKGGQKRGGEDEAWVEKMGKPSRWLLSELLNDIVYAVKTTDGCVDFVQAAEELARLGAPPGGVDTV